MPSSNLFYSTDSGIMEYWSIGFKIGVDLNFYKNFLKRPPDFLTTEFQGVTRNF